MVKRAWTWVKLGETCAYDQNAFYEKCNLKSLIKNFKHQYIELNDSLYLQDTQLFKHCILNKIKFGLVPFLLINIKSNINHGTGYSLEEMKQNLHGSRN